MKQSITIVIFLLCIFVIPVTYAQNEMASLTIKNTRDGDKVTLRRTHGYNDEGEFSLLNSKEIVIENSAQRDFRNLPLGIYEIVVNGVEDNIYRIAFPNTLNENPYHAVLSLKHGVLSFEKRIGKTIETLEHHHLENPLIINPKESFYYELRVNVPTNFKASDYNHFQIEDAIPSSVQFIENSLIVKNASHQMIDGKDYEATMYSSLKVNFTEEGLNKIQPNTSIRLIFEVKVIDELQDEPLSLVPNDAQLMFERQGAQHQIDTEKDYFSTQVKTIIVQKIDSITKEPLQGATFAFHRGDQVLTEGVTDSSGQVIIKGLKEGSHAIYEKEAPTGYKQIPGPVTIDIGKDDQTVTVVIPNDKLPGDEDNTEETESDTEHSETTEPENDGGHKESTEHQDTESSENKPHDKNKPISIPQTGSILLVILAIAGFGLHRIGIKLIRRADDEDKK